MSAARRWLVVVLIAGLSACATVQPRLYSAGELARVADKCRVARTEVAQIGADVSLLYVLTPMPSDEQLDCVERWAQRHGLRMVYVEAVEYETDQTEP